MVVVGANADVRLLPEVAAVPGRDCSCGVLRELVVSLKLIVISKDTAPGVHLDPCDTFVQGDIQIQKGGEGPAIRPCIHGGIPIVGTEWRIDR